VIGRCSSARLGIGGWIGILATRCACTCAGEARRRLTWSPAKSTRADAFLVPIIRSRPEPRRWASRRTCAVAYSHARIEMPRQ
jgi:hypothetical protein